MIGKNYTRFGEILNENMLHIMENFANASVPVTQQKVCFGTIQQIAQLKIYDNGVWSVILSGAGTTKIEFRNRKDTGGNYP